MPVFCYQMKLRNASAWGMSGMVLGSWNGFLLRILLQSNFLLLLSPQNTRKEESKSLSEDYTVCIFEEEPLWYFSGLPISAYFKFIFCFSHLVLAFLWDIRFITELWLRPIFSPWKDMSSSFLNEEGVKIIIQNPLLDSFLDTDCVGSRCCSVW